MKDKTSMNREGDLVLIYYQDQPSLYARIEAIEPDVKKDWYRATLLLLTIPTQTVTWILREEYINGASFTLGGNAMKLEGVKPTVLDRADPIKDELRESGEEEEKKGKVIPFQKPS